MKGLNGMFIKAKDIVKIYNSGEASSKVLDGLSVEIDKGEICAILGASGSGKSTFLNVLGGLDSINSGSITIDGHNITDMNQKELVKFRKNNFGYVFQFYNLIANLSLKENVRVGEYLTQSPLNMDELLELLELTPHKDKFPSQLSGGQQQRCSIARALIKNPKILLCDEPTGALDSKSAKEILLLLEKINKKYKTTILIVTHNEVISNMADRVILMKDGKIVNEYCNDNKKSVSELDF